MVPPRPPVDDEDRRLFRAAVGRLRPLTKGGAGTRPRGAVPAPEPTQSLRDEARVRDELLAAPIDPAVIEAGDEIHHLHPGQPPRLLKRLRRGQFSVQAELDLHEMTVPVARDAIKRFIDDCRKHGELCVRIVHGKGLRSKAGGPVLKRLTDGLLRRRSDVLAFASARPAEGGTGAVIELLRR